MMPPPCPGFDRFVPARAAAFPVLYKSFPATGGEQKVNAAGVAAGRRERRE